VTTPAQLAAQREALSRYWTHGEGSIEWRPARLASSAGWCAPAETNHSFSHTTTPPCPPHSSATWQRQPNNSDNVGMRKTHG